MSRPEKPIDWNKVDQLLLAGCHGTEIAPHFDIGPDRLYDRIKEKYGIGFTEYSQLKRQQGDSLLRAKQYEKALKGENTLLIWLGKNRLKQREHEVLDVPPGDFKADSENQEMSENHKLRLRIEELEKQIENKS
jgi:hypothetical protein